MKKMDSTKYWFVFLIVLAHNFLSIDEVVCKTTFFSHESHSNTFDDGKQMITRLTEKNSHSGSPGTTKHKIMVAPSKIGSSSSSSSSSSFHHSHRDRIKGGHSQIEALLKENNKRFERLFNRHSSARASGGGRVYGGRALSGSDGGDSDNYWSPQVFMGESTARATNGLGVEVAKVLNVKQGHYADLYNELDFPNATTKPPADAIEEAMRLTVLQLFDEQQQQQNGKTS